MDLTVTGGVANRAIEKYKGKTAKAIYELNGDQLKWCANEPGKDARPTKFGSEEPDDAINVVFKRKEK